MNSRFGLFCRRISSCAAAASVEFVSDSETEGATLASAELSCPLATAARPLVIPFFRFLDNLGTGGALRLEEVDRLRFGGEAGPRDLVLLRDDVTATEAGTAAGAAATAVAAAKLRENAVSSFAAITEAGTSSPKGTFRFFLVSLGEEKKGRAWSVGGEGLKA